MQNNTLHKTVLLFGKDVGWEKQLKRFSRFSCAEANCVTVTCMNTFVLHTYNPSASTCCRRKRSICSRGGTIFRLVDTTVPQTAYHLLFFSVILTRLCSTLNALFILFFSQRTPSDHHKHAKCKFSTWNILGKDIFNLTNPADVEMLESKTSKEIAWNDPNIQSRQTNVSFLLPSLFVNVC